MYIHKILPKQFQNTRKGTRTRNFARNETAHRLQKENYIPIIRTIHSVIIGQKHFRFGLVVTWKVTDRVQHEPQTGNIDRDKYRRRHWSGLPSSTTVAWLIAASGARVFGGTVPLPPLVRTNRERPRPPPVNDPTNHRLGLILTITARWLFNYDHVLSFFVSFEIL